MNISGPASPESQFPEICCSRKGMPPSVSLSLLEHQAGALNSKAPPFLLSCMFVLLCFLVNTRPQLSTMKISTDRHLKPTSEDAWASWQSWGSKEQRTRN